MKSLAPETKQGGEPTGGLMLKLKDVMEIKTDINVWENVNVEVSKEETHSQNQHDQMKEKKGSRLVGRSMKMSKEKGRKGLLKESAMIILRKACAEEPVPSPWSEFPPKTGKKTPTDWGLGGNWFLSTHRAQCFLRSS